MTISEKKLTVLDQISASDRVRKKIIDTASLLYAKKGYTATSIEEISEKAGVTLPVTYHYVKNKSEIMKMIMEDVLHNFRESLTREVQSIQDPEEKLAVATGLYFKVAEQQSDKALLIYRKSSALDKAAKAKVMQLEVEISEIFSRIIQEGIEKGVFKAIDVDLMAYNILMMAHMWILKKWHFKNRLTLDQYIDLQWAVIRNAVREERA
jgi:AcrR family transcriptional regulator